jgi:subtilisin family serine protease
MNVLLLFNFLTRVLSVFILSISISACNTPLLPEPATKFVSIKLTSNDNEMQLKQLYGGKIIIFSPALSMAIIQTPKPVRPDDTAVISVGDTLNLRQPESSNFQNAAIGGWNSWVSGAQVSSSGWNSWVSGWNSWVSGNTSFIIPPLPQENQAAFDLLGIPQAHAAAKKFGEGVKIALIDTGLDLNHLAFQKRLAPQEQWRDFVDKDNVPQDQPSNTTPSGYGHGTAVAGLILQMAPRATILPIRVFKPDGSSNTEDLYQAIAYAVSMNADIINISGGSLEPDFTLHALIGATSSLGIYTVAAAGNTGLVDHGAFPARLSYSLAPSYPTKGFVFGVGSMKTNYAISSFSASGDGIFTYLPGENLTTLYPNNQTAKVTGTSFATPLMTGVLALALSELPQDESRKHLADYLNQSMDSNHIWNKYYLPKPESERKWGHGNGVLDAELLLYNLPNWTFRNAPQNLLKNPQFLEDFKDWDVLGNPSLKNATIELPGDQTIGSSHIQQDVLGLQPNTTYSVRAKINTEKTGGFLCLQASGFNNDDPKNNYTDTCTSSTTPSLVGLRFTTGANTTAVRININSVQNMKAFVSDLMVFQLQ